MRIKEAERAICEATIKIRKGKVGIAAASLDYGQPRPDWRLITASNQAVADSRADLAVTKCQNGNIQLTTSQDHYVFNLAWLKLVPLLPKK